MVTTKNNPMNKLILILALSFGTSLSLSSEGVILVPQFGNKKTGVKMAAGNDIVDFKVDRAGGETDDDDDKTEARHKIESYQGKVLEIQNEHGHIKISPSKGKDLYLALAPDSRAVKDVVISNDSLVKEDSVAVVGYKRGYVGGLPRGEPRRRILGSTFIFKLGEQTQEVSKPKRSQTGVTLGAVLSIDPLIIVDGDKNYYEVRPATNSQTVHVQQAGWDDIKENKRVIAKGYEERITLRPKGKTISRYVFQTQSLRVLADELKDSDYRKFLKFDFAQ